MKHGSLPRSIVHCLPLGATEPDHRPDGLTEADVDALIAEAGFELVPDLPADDDEHEPASVVPLRSTAEHPTEPWGNEAA